MALEYIGGLTSFLNTDTRWFDSVYTGLTRFRIGTTLYALGALGVAPADLAMWKSTDEGVTWGTNQDTYDPGTQGIVWGTGIISGTDILIVALSHTTTNGTYLALTYDTLTDTFSEGIGTLPLTIATTANLGTNTMTGHVTGFTYESGSGELFVLGCGTAARSFSLHHGDPTVDISWTTNANFYTATSGGGGCVLIPSSVSGRVHCFYRGNLDAGQGRVQTYNVSGDSFSTALDYGPNRSSYDHPLPGPTNVLALGDDGVNGQVILTVGASAGGIGESDGDAFWRLVNEDVNGDISSVVGGAILDANADVGNAQMCMPIIPSQFGPAGTFHVAHYDLQGVGPERYLLRTTDNYADTFDAGVDITGNGPVVLLTATWFDRDGTRVLAGGSNLYYEHQFTSLEATIQPISDIVSDRWESAPTASQTLFSQVDEVTPSDTDYIYVDL